MGESYRHDLAQEIINRMKLQARHYRHKCSAAEIAQAIVGTPPMVVTIQALMPERAEKLYELMITTPARDAEHTGRDKVALEDVYFGVRLAHGEWLHKKMSGEGIAGVTIFGSVVGAMAELLWAECKKRRAEWNSLQVSD